jgi:tight adherence protein B
VVTVSCGLAVERRLAQLGVATSPAGGGAGSGRGRTFDERLPALCLPLDPAAAGTVVRAVALGVPVLGLLVGGVVLAFAGALAVVAGAVVVVRTAPARRAARYERELPELLEQVARHLRSGGSLAQAVGAAVPLSTPSGLSEEWAEVHDLVSSVGAVAALDGWGAAPSARPSTRLAAAALAMAADTGGSPARAVDGVAATLRSRLAVADEVRALASQARASSVVIALAPLGFAAFAGATDDRTAAFFHSPAGLLVAATGVGLDAVGAWWMARLCRPPAAERPGAP